MQERSNQNQADEIALNFHQNMHQILYITIIWITNIYTKKSTVFVSYISSPHETHIWEVVTPRYALIILLIT